MPFDRQRRYMDVLGLPYATASALVPDLALCGFFEAALHDCGKAQEIANYVVNDLRRELTAAGTEGEGPLPLAQSRISPAHVAEIVRLTDEGAITRQVAREVFVECFKTGGHPAAIVDAKGLRASGDSGELEKLAREAIAADPAAVAKFKGGNDKALNALKGPIMKATRGKADPRQIDEVLRKLLS